MTKVTIEKSLATGRTAYAPGDVVDLPEKQADSWVKSGAASHKESKRKSKTEKPQED